VVALQKDIKEPRMRLAFTGYAQPNFTFYRISIAWAYNFAQRRRRALTLTFGANPISSWINWNAAVALARAESIEITPRISRSSMSVSGLEEAMALRQNFGSGVLRHSLLWCTKEVGGMLVQDPTKRNDVDALFSQARHAGAYQPLLSNVNPLLTSSLDGATGLLWMMSIRKSECPKELEPVDRTTPVHVSLMRKEEDCRVRQERKIPFQGMGRTLGSTSSNPVAEPTVDAPARNTALHPAMALTSTSIQLRLADGTRMVSRFNSHHTIRDIHGFIDASRPGGPRTYQLQTVGFPPKQLADPDQTIEQAGLANSVVIQKLLHKGCQNGSDIL
ncbi:hypothetical protein RJ639_045316, partial [Escallonia herrerae]